MTALKAGPKAAVTAEPLDFAGWPHDRAKRRERFVREFVVTPKGAGALKAFRLRPWQREIVRGAYAPGVRTALVSLPRANGKTALAAALGVEPRWLLPGYEDAFYYLWKERRLPTNVDPFESNLKDPLERARLSRIFSQGLDFVVGYALPLKREWDGGRLRWSSGPWFLREERCYLIPGDSPVGYRLPLDSLPWLAPEDRPVFYSPDPAQPVPAPGPPQAV